MIKAYTPRRGAGARAFHFCFSGPAKTIGKILLPLAAGALLVVTACGGGEGEPAAHAQGAGGPGMAQGPAGQRPRIPPVPVAVEAAKVGTISSYYTATATLAAEKEAQILARVSGVVESIQCEEGDEVSEGQVLLKIDNDEYRFRLAQAEASTADLRSRFQRLEEMQKRDLVSAEEYETLKNDLKSAEAEEGLARLTLSYTEVRAPFRGAVVSRLVDVGQTVNEGTALFVLSDFDPLLARVFVPSKEFKKLKPDQPVDLLLESSQKRLRGRIKLVSPVIDPNSGTIKVTIEIPEYPDGVRPGDFAEVRIVTENRTGSTLVPKIALVTDRGEQVVYVAADSTAERRVVEVGFEDDEMAEITSGVSPNEPVVVKGQRSLKHGSPIKILEGGGEGDVADTEPAEQKAQGRESKRRKGS
jgi:membrane fusion protein (multidrug efflux system)